MVAQNYTLIFSVGCSMFQKGGRRRRLAVPVDKKQEHNTQRGRCDVTTLGVSTPLVLYRATLASDKAEFAFSSMKALPYTFCRSIWVISHINIHSGSNSVNIWQLTFQINAKCLLREDIWRGQRCSDGTLQHFINITSWARAYRNILHALPLSPAFEIQEFISSQSFNNSWLNVLFHMLSHCVAIN